MGKHVIPNLAVLKGQDYKTNFIELIATENIKYFPKINRGNDSRLDWFGLLACFLLLNFENQIIGSYYKLLPCLLFTLNLRLSKFFSFLMALNSDLSPCSCLRKGHFWRRSVNCSSLLSLDLSSRVWDMRAFDFFAGRTKNSLSSSTGETHSLSLNNII